MTAPPDGAQTQSGPLRSIVSPSTWRLHQGRSIAELSITQSRNHAITSKAEVLMTSSDPVDVEVPAVDREHGSQVISLRNCDQGRVCEVHGQIRVLDHQLECACQCRVVQSQCRQAASYDEVHKALGSDTRLAEEIERFGQYREGGAELPINPLQGANAPIVRSVCRIKQRHQWSGVNQDHEDVSVESGPQRPPSRPSPVRWHNRPVQGRAGGTRQLVSPTSPS